MLTHTRLLLFLLHGRSREEFCDEGEDRSTDSGIAPRPQIEDAKIICHSE
jgi:hypothetical protein